MRFLSRWEVTRTGGCAQVRELLCEASRRTDVAALVFAAAEARAHPAEARSLL